MKTEAPIAGVDTGLRSGRRGLFLALLLLAGGISPDTQADDTNLVASFSTEDLLTQVSRYGSTPAKKAAKSAARAELLARGTNALAALMAHAHEDNIALQVFTQEAVERLDKGAAASALLGFTTSDRPRARRMAAYYLGLHETPEHAAAVTPLLKDDEACGAAIRTLGKWKVRSAVPLIIPFLRHEKELRRVAAVNALREIGDPGSATNLIEALGDPVFTVREAAQKALVALGPPAERAMIRALSTAEGPPRRCLIRALGQSKSRAARRAVGEFARFPDPDVAADAQDAMARQAP